MVNMETPKCRKLRRVKGSSKKKKKTIRIDEVRETKIEDPGSSNVTPPRAKAFTIVERGQEEVRGVEWQYHGKFVESDIPVVWGSPHGSPVVNTVQTAHESPIHKCKQRTTKCAPRKLNSEECEPPQFFNEILALSEKIKSEEKNNDQSQDSQEKELLISKNMFDESFSNFFDEDMNECMLQCSQVLEQTSSESITPTCAKTEVNCGHEDQENKQSIVKSETVCSSPRKRSSAGTSSKYLFNTTSNVFHPKNNVHDSETKFSRIGNKNYVHSKRKVNTYVFQGRVLGSRGNADTLNSRASGSGQGKINTPLEDKKSFVQPKTQKYERNSKSNRSCHVSLNNSFETVKESFLDDDLEFLSTVPVDLEVVTKNENKEHVQRTHEGALEPKQQNNEIQHAPSVLEDSTFEEGILQYLDTIESNVTPSPPLRCTPEEIEKKRQEAKMKLQKKNLLKK